MSSKALFKAEHIFKNFGIVQALKDFEIEIYPGEIRGLIGENGSGKSTFSAIASGTLKANEGLMFLEDEPYSPHGTVDAMDKGISMVVQEQGTITGITVAANVFFGKEDLFAKNGFMDIRRMNEETTKALEAIGVKGIAPQTLIDTLSFEDRKLIELARSMYTKVGRIDFEPTMEEYFENGTFHICYGVQMPYDPFMSAIILINKLIGTPVSDVPAIIVTPYLPLTTAEEAKWYSYLV